MTKVEIKVEGMSCNHCVKAVEVDLDELELASFEVEIGKVSATFDETIISEKRIAETIECAGYKVVK